MLLANSMGQELLSYSFLLKKIQVYNVSEKILKNSRVLCSPLNLQQHSAFAVMELP